MHRGKRRAYGAHLINHHLSLHKNAYALNAFSRLLEVYNYKVSLKLNRK